MARAARGGAFSARGNIYLRVTIAPGQRRAESLPWVTAEQWSEHQAGETCPCVACVRARQVQTWITAIREAGKADDFAENVIRVAATADAAKMRELAKAVEGIVGGTIKPKRRVVSADRPTFRSFSERWTSGELHRLYPDHVRAKRTAKQDAERLEVLYKSVGDIELANFTLDDAQRAMRALPAGVRTSGARRHYAQLLSRVLSLAVFPTRTIERSPIPRGFLPRSSANAKAKACLYPSEDAALLACTDVPLWRRMLWGVLAREGMREGEALKLTWADLDLERGVVRLDTNKTDDPRAWALGSDVAAALSAWRESRQTDSESSRVFPLAGLHKTQLAETLRSDLHTAGISRTELFEASSTRLALRVHDLRATFVTLALASDRTEAWVTDRTGHRSSDMVHRYKRAARTARELGLGWLTPLGPAVPELAAAVIAAAEAAAKDEESDEVPARNPSTHHGFRRKDSNLRKRNQNPLSCH